MHRFGGRVILGFALALVSAALTPWIVFGRVEPLGIPFDAPVKVTYYRWTVALLLIGGACAVSSLVVVAQARRSALIHRWVAMGVSVLGAFGLVEAGSFLLILIGLCGPSVLAGFCRA